MLHENPRWLLKSCVKYLPEKAEVYSYEKCKKDADRDAGNRNTPYAFPRMSEYAESGGRRKQRKKNGDFFCWMGLFGREKSFYRYDRSV